MNWSCFTSVVIVLLDFTLSETLKCCENERSISAWQGSWAIYPTTASWSVQTKIPMTEGE